MPYPTQIRHIIASLAETQSQVDVVEGHLNRLRMSKQTVALDLSYGTHSDDINGNPKIKLEGDTLISVLERQRDQLEDRVVELSNRVIDQTRDNQNDRAFAEQSRVSPEEDAQEEDVPLPIPDAYGVRAGGKSSGVPRLVSPEDEIGL